MMLFRREGLIPEKRTKALMNTPNRTEMEAMGADITEAEAETEAMAASDAGQDAGIAASSEMNPVIAEQNERERNESDR